MKLTKIQKDDVIKKLSSIYGCVQLMCDGYKVSLAVERTSALSFRIMTYIDGSFKGLWMNGETEHPEQKFLRKRSRPVYSKSFISKMEKILGKEAVAKEERYKKVYVMYNPDWASGKAAINHLCKACEVIEIVEAQ